MAMRSARSRAASKARSLCSKQTSSRHHTHEGARRHRGAPHQTPARGFDRILTTRESRHPDADFDSPRLGRARDRFKEPAAPNIHALMITLPVCESTLTTGDDPTVRPGATTTYRSPCVSTARPGTAVAEKSVTGHWQCLPKSLRRHNRLASATRNRNGPLTGPVLFA